MIKNIFSKTPNSSTYIVGFGLSLFLSILAFGLTQLHISSSHVAVTHQVLLPALIGLALLQMIVQLVFFLHLVHEDSPRWNLIFFISTFGIITMVVVASIWIMDHLNYNMKPETMKEYIFHDEGIKTEEDMNQNMNSNTLQKNTNMHGDN